MAASTTTGTLKPAAAAPKAVRARHPSRSRGVMLSLWREGRDTVAISAHLATACDGINVFSTRRTHRQAITFG